MNIYNIEIAYLYFGIRIILSLVQFISNVVLLNLWVLFITTVAAHWLMFVLQGINLDELRLEKDDVVIKIGKSECNITSTGRQLTCRPPREPPSPMKGGRYPEVEVSHSVVSEWSIGYRQIPENDTCILHISCWPEMPVCIWSYLVI